MVEMMVEMMFEMMVEMMFEMMVDMMIEKKMLVMVIIVLEEIPPGFLCKEPSAVSFEPLIRPLL